MKKKKTKLKKEISTRILDLKQFIKGVVQYRKEYEESGIENPDDKDFHDNVFNTVEWLIEHHAYEEIQNIYDELDENEIEAIDDAINIIVYRFEYFVEDSKGDIDSIVVTPFAVPMMIMVPMKYKDRVTHLEGLPKSVTETASTKFLRNCLDLCAEPSIIIDGKLWRNDEAGWDDFDVIMQYLRGFIMYASKMSSIVPSLKVRNVKDNNERIEEKDEMYVLTRTITGLVISGDIDIDSKLFGYNDAEKGVMENHFTREFAVSCESELNGIGIKGAKVLPLSQWPIELWEVPETAIHFVHILDLRKMAACAESDTPYKGRNRTLKIGVDQKRESVDVKLSVYDERFDEPFFTYTWDVAYGLETPESVLDDIMRICTEELSVSEVLIEELDVNKVDQTTKQIYEEYKGGYNSAKK